MKYRIIIDLPEELDKKLRKFMAYTGAKTKAIAICDILEIYDIKGDFKKWIEGGEEVEE